MAPSPTVQDHVALVEIELCGELMIAASAEVGDRLTPDRIDEVLRVATERAARVRRPERRRVVPDPSRSGADTARE